MRRAGTADQLRKSCVCVWCDCELCETCDVCRLCDLCCHQRGSTTLCTISAVSAVSDCDGHKNVFTLSSHVQYTYIRCEPVHATPHQSAEPTGAASRTNRLVRKGRDRRRRARPGKSIRGGRRGGAAQERAATSCLRASVTKPAAVRSIHVQPTRQEIGKAPSRPLAWLVRRAAAVREVLEALRDRNCAPRRVHTLPPRSLAVLQACGERNVTPPQ